VSLRKFGERQQPELKQKFAIRLFTRRGYDCTARYPLICAAVAAIPARSVILDGEAVFAMTPGLRKEGRDGDWRLARSPSLGLGLTPPLVALSAIQSGKPC
jgi:hypothetical protein